MPFELLGLVIRIICAHTNSEENYSLYNNTDTLLLQTTSQNQHVPVTSLLLLPPRELESYANIVQALVAECIY